MITDHEEIHLMAAKQWLTRCEQERDEGGMRPGLSQAYVVITHLLRLINRLMLEVEVLEHSPTSDIPNITQKTNWKGPGDE